MMLKKNMTQTRSIIIKKNIERKVSFFRNPFKCPTTVSYIMPGMESVYIIKKSY